MILARFKQGDWLTPGRIRAYTTVLLLFELSMFCFFAAGTHGLIVPLQHPTSTDFVSFYGAGTVANSPAPWLVYDRETHHAAEQAATQQGIPYNYFYYPPVFLLICSVLARLPYLAAYVAFQAAGLAAVMAAVRKIIRHPAGLVPLAFPAVFWTIGTGQNAMLTAALFAWGTLCLSCRPVMAGVLLGAVCYKPQFGILVPVALAAGGYWRTFAVAALTVAGLTGLSAALYGIDTWHEFLLRITASQAVYGGKAIHIAGLTNLYGALLSKGVPAGIAAMAQSVLTVALGAIVWRVWRRGGSLAVRAAVLTAAIPVAAPISLFYDLMTTGVALSWLARRGLDSGFAPWERSCLAIAFISPLLAGNLDGSSQLLVAPCSAMCGLGLALAAAWREATVAASPDGELTRPAISGL